MGKSIREVYGTVLAELGDTNENIVVLDADLSGSTKSGIFAKAHPERHFNMGIAESDMVATAAGLSTTGKIPFVNTFTVFLTTLGLISARAQVCYGNLNVKFGGAYCGMSDALDGATHHATEAITVWIVYNSSSLFPQVYSVYELSLDYSTLHISSANISPA